MRYPLLEVHHTVQYYVLHALEMGMVDVWSIRKHLAPFNLSCRQISSALQRLKRDGLVTVRSEDTQPIWSLTESEAA